MNVGKVVRGCRTGLAFAAALVAAAVGGASLATDYSKAQTERWRCRLCPFEAASQQRGGVTAGVLAVSESQPRFGRDNGLDGAGNHADIALDYRNRDESGRIVGASGTNLGLDSRQLRLDLRDRRIGAAALAWREIPRNTATDGRTPYVGWSSLTLPSEWVAANGADGMTSWEALAQPFGFSTHRRRFDAEWRLDFGPGWKVGTNYRRETKRGAGETAADFLYQATVLPKPVDFTTEELGAIASFGSEAYLVAIEAHNATFDNAIAALDWQSAYQGPASAGRKALPPGNSLRTLAWTGRAAVGRTEAHARLAWARGRQDEKLLPSGTSATASPLPTASLDGRIHGFTGLFRVVSRITSRLRLDLAHRERERDSRTPIRSWTPMLGDVVALASRDNRAHGFDRRRSELRVRYRLPHGVRLTAGASRGALRRHASPGSRSEIARNEEDGLWLEAAVRRRGLGMSVKATQAHRRASMFEKFTTNNPRMRRFHQAERRQRAWKARVHGAVGNSGLSLGLYGDVRRDEYPGSALGLLDDENRAWGVDFSYALGKRGSVSGFYDAQRSASSTAGSVAFDVADWWTAARDVANGHGLTFESRLLPSQRLHLSLAFVRSAGEGSYRTAWQEVAGTPTEPAFPALISNHRSLDLTLRYRWSDRFTLALRHYAERYRAADWAHDGVAHDTIRNVLTTERAMPRYSNHFTGVSVERSL